MSSLPKIIPAPGTQLYIDGYTGKHQQHIEYIGYATLQTNGKWTALARVGNALCLVECCISIGDVERIAYAAEKR